MTEEVTQSLSAGRLRLLKVLGKGGVGTVYLAYNEPLGVYRAVKVLARKYSGKSTHKTRFETEARIQARLHHPNIVQVFDIVHEGDKLYFVMEWVPGGSFWEILRETGPIQPHQAIHAMSGVLDALQVAHSTGIIHRDVKPHNVLVDRDGVPKLADFGVAHLDMADSRSITRTGVIMGTWSFMAPEQRASSRKVDNTADIYAAGATLFTLLTNVTEPNLFDYSETDEALAHVPVPIRPVICRATRYEPHRRYPTVEAMKADLERARPLLEGSDPGPLVPELRMPEAPPQTVPAGATLLPTGNSHSASLLRDSQLPPTREILLASSTVPSPSVVSSTLEEKPQKSARTASQPTFSFTVTDSEPAVSVPALEMTLNERRTDLDFPIADEPSSPLAMDMDMDEPVPDFPRARVPGPKRLLLLLPILLVVLLAALWLLSGSDTRTGVSPTSPSTPAGPRQPADPSLSHSSRESLSASSHPTGPAQPEPVPRKQTIPGSTTAGATEPPSMDMGSSLAVETVPESVSTMAVDTPEPANQTQPEPAGQAQPEPAGQAQPEPVDQAPPETRDEAQPEPTDLAPPEAQDETQPEPADHAPPEAQDEIKPGSDSQLDQQAAAAVQRVQRIHWAELLDCHAAALEHTPGVEGFMLVTMEVDTGIVRSAEVSANFTGDDQLASCVVSAAKTWSMPELVTGIFAIRASFKVKETWRYLARSVVAQHRRGIEKQCRINLPGDFQLKGNSISLRVTVKDGSATNTDLLADTTAQPGFVRCLQDQIVSWPFPGGMSDQIDVDLAW